MSKSFVVYDLASNEIFGLFKTSDQAEQGYPEEAGQGKILIDPDHLIFAEQEKWRVSSGALILKTGVVIASAKSLIVADGIDEATITFAGLLGNVEVSLGGDLSVTVLASDPTLVLTSDVPRQFQINVSDALHWSDPIFVEAQ